VTKSFHIIRSQYIQYMQIVGKSLKASIYDPINQIGLDELRSREANMHYACQQDCA
jgi:hypothetical protein